MFDPRLNSVHLSFPRRAEYRATRLAILGAEGEMTLAGDPHARPAPPIGTNLPGSLFFLHDWQSGTCYPLKVGLNTVGRFPNNDIVPPEDQRTRSVSRRHCVVIVHATGGFELYDTASRNGTFVNGRRLTNAVWLAARDIVQLAGWKLQFVCADEAGVRDESDDTPFTG
jgi:pSer/pThr/pTyr-binding forkhead associated (FHA) protein